jgi:AbrB family looped-hinge helix DNA binding protein
VETTLTSKGHVTIPKHIRDSLTLEPGCKLTFDVNNEGDVVLRKSGPVEQRRPDRFDRARGAAEIKLGCSTDEYMELLRGYSDDPACCQCDLGHLGRRSHLVRVV